MLPDGYPVRSDGIVWRDIAGEVVIVNQDDGTIRTLNRTASYIWTLADGTRRLIDIADSLSERYEVTREQACADASEFCLQLVEAGLIAVRGVPEVVADVVPH